MRRGTVGGGIVPEISPGELISDRFSEPVLAKLWSVAAGIMQPSRLDLIGLPPEPVRIGHVSRFGLRTEETRLPV